MNNSYKGLRKRIKIKAYIFLLAWLVIFAHSIVPHNHFEENKAGCHELFHGASAGHEDNNHNQEYKNQPESEITCHFSAFLFNKFDQENLIIITQKVSIFSLPLLTGNINPSTPEFCFSEPYYGTSLLRAPPKV